MTTKTSTIVVLGALLVISTPAHAEDCQLAARYQGLADKALDEFREEDALELLERATENCNQFDYFQSYGELATRFGDEDRTNKAMDAFVTARELADNPKDEARAVAAYAEVLFHSGDRSRAKDYVSMARNLDPSNSEITDLTTRIYEESERLTDEDVRRGRASLMFREMPRVTSSKPAAASAPAEGGAPTPAPREVVETPKINVALNFEYGSTELDDVSRANLVVLANALAREDESQKFIFEGHADRRGDDTYNRDLSLRRARAVRELVIDLEPQLSGRISVVGKGEDDPVMIGDLEIDHSANRRLEVKYR